jgi:hypothetical protein
MAGAEAPVCLGAESPDGEFARGFHG